LLFGLPLILPALGIAFLVGGAAILLGLAGRLTRFVAKVPSGTTLIGLIRSPGCTDRCHEESRRQHCSK
jgi:hypothetical protein